jgi:sulfur carrier protein
VPKTQYEEKILTDDDVIEVVSFVGGGWFGYKN